MNVLLSYVIIFAAILSSTDLGPMHSIDDTPVSVAEGGSGGVSVRVASCDEGFSNRRNALIALKSSMDIATRAPKWHESVAKCTSMLRRMKKVAPDQRERLKYSVDLMKKYIESLIKRAQEIGSFCDDELSVTRPHQLDDEVFCRLLQGKRSILEVFKSADSQLEDLLKECIRLSGGGAAAGGAASMKTPAGAPAPAAPAPKRFRTDVGTG